jgi:DNA-binding CsgD family transcriptional regulator
LKYLGLTLLLAWHYCLWFVPNSYLELFILDDRITFSWLIALALAALTHFSLALGLGGKRHLTPRPAIIWIATLAGSAGTGVFTLFAVNDPNPAGAYLLSAVIGISAGLLWLLWGERYAAQRAKFTIRRIAPTYAGFLLASLLLASVLPGVFSPLFTSLLPLFSGLLLHVSAKGASGQRYPRLLPRQAARLGRLPILTVCVISFVASFVSYFTVAIVPWEAVAVIDRSFTIGVAIGALFILVIAGLQLLHSTRYTIFRTFPWLLFCEVIACGLFLFSFATGFSAFLLALAISSVLEILLTMYMGGLTLRGYVAPVVAFGLSGGAIRLGICLGNGLALVYEHVPWLAEVWTVPTMLAFIAILTGLLIPLVRQEYNISELVRSPQSISELDAQVAQAAAEFKLSEREREIVSALARGYTASAVAEKLFISPHTVNTHIQHIYDKMGIHKRSELLNYLNKRD